MLINILVAWIVFDAVNAGVLPDSSTAAAKNRPVVAEVQAGPAEHVGEEAEVEAEEGASCVGYVQGMSFLAMNLLWHAGREEAAFWVFVAMMQRYDLRCMFQAPDMHGLRKRTFATTQLLHYAMPALSDHLAEYLQNNLGLLLTDWLLTLFASSVALGPLGQLWDRFFELGFVWIYRVILARLRCLQKWLLEETDFARLMHIVRFAHVDFDWVNGQVAPRLRSLHPGSAAGTAEVARAAGPAKQGLLQRLVRGRRRRQGEVEVAPPEEPAYSGQPAAWTCQVCNGSEDCWSWQTIVTVLANDERLPASVAERFEAMFSAAALAGPVAAPAGVAIEQPQQEATTETCQDKEAFSSGNSTSCLRAENIQLRGENVQLHAENVQLRAELELVRRELEELRRATLCPAADS